ncbi:MAG: hypothetical protein AAFY41_06430 [Bacteroidota bacterium]
MKALDILKAALVIIIAVFLFGFIFNFLFRVGIILLIALGAIYLVKKILFD